MINQSSSTPEPSKFKWKITKTILLIIFGLLVISFLAVFLIKGIDEFPPEDSDFKLEKIEIPEENNAFYDFIKATEKIYWPTEKTEFIYEILEGKQWDEEFVGEFLRKNEDAFLYLDKAINREIFQLPEFQNPESLEINTPLRSMGSWRNIARIGSIKALYLFKQDKEKEAFNEVIKIIRIGQLIEDAPRPILIQLHIAQTIKEIGLERLRTMVKNTTLPPEILKSYIKELEKFKTNKTGIKIILHEEYITIVREIDAAEKDERSREHLFGLNPPFYVKLMLKFNYYYKPNQTKRLFLEGFRNEIEMSDKKYYKEINSLKLSVPSLISISPVTVIFTENFLGKVFYNLFMVDSSDFLSIKNREDFTLSGTQTLLAIRAYEKDKGELPNSLEELLPDYLSEIPKDPFDGNSMRYSASKKIIYSVGKDLVDSGGSEGEALKKMIDLTFKIEF